MVSKRGLISFIFTFTFILLIGSVSAASCSITTSCNAANTVLKLSATSNAHGQVYSQSGYSYYLCCDFTGTHTCDGSNTVLRLSATTNAHAQIPSLSTYTTPVCFGNLSCTSTTSSSCPSEYPIAMHSLSASTNAHLGTFSTYSTKICCKFKIPEAVCGDGKVEGNETCDDGNTNSGDGCSYPACIVEPGYIPNPDGTCVYQSNPSSYWQKNGASFSGGEIKTGDILTMRFNDDFCLSSGPTFTVYKGTTAVASASGTVVTGNPGYTYADYNVITSFLTTLGPGTSSIFFRITTPSTFNGPTIDVTPRYCGDGVCTSANGENCETCLADCPCSSSQRCESGVCRTYCGNGICDGTENCENCPGDCGCTSGQECSNGACVALCDLTSASWNYSTPVGTTILAGTPVRLQLTSVAGTNCNGKTITFEIREKDGFWSSDDSVTPAPSPITFPSSGTSAYVTWNAVFLDDADLGESNPPEYYFKANVVGYSELIESSNTGVDDPLLLRVRLPATCPNGVCGADENCETCPADCPCPLGQVCSNGTCVNECVLTSKSWNVSSTVGGQKVQLRAYGNNCNGQTVTFEILEYDFLSADDPVQYPPSPVSAVMNSGQAVTSWTAEWPGYGDGETGTLEYYFIPTISVLGKSLTEKTPRLSVTQAITCPNGVCGADETCSTCPEDCGSCCGDGICNYGETCSTCPEDCGACCGNGICETGEECDDGGTVSGDGCSETCTIETGYTCTCSFSSQSVCTLLCGNGVINSPEQCDGINLGGNDCKDIQGDGWTGDLNCYAPGTTDQCQFNTEACVAPLICTIRNATWSKTTAMDLESVSLIINTDNCDNGESISFVVEEYDSGLFDSNDPVSQNPSNAIINSNSATGIWQAEWQDDTGGVFSSEENPPEFIFTATIISNGQSRESSNMLNVYQNLFAEINYCSDYLNDISCDEDEYDVGKNSVPSTIYCGGVFNPSTGCYDKTDCGCSWNSASGICEGSWSSESLCGVCGNGVEEFGEECDDGNNIDGDGCSSDCKFEPGILPPCPYGTTLCSDGTCSKNCYVTDEAIATCNYNGFCEEGEGCNCLDCHGKIDTCGVNLLCSVFNFACCNGLSDGYCDPECSYVDPDCGPAICGNGYREIGEECDLGARNGVENSGCTGNCKLYAVNTLYCTEGTTLCGDDTYSLNCHYTDDGFANCEINGVCELGEGCNCPDCGGEIANSELGLECSVVDQACCNPVSDGYCNPYCHYYDPDCMPKIIPPGTDGGDSFVRGICIYTDQTTDTCEDDMLLMRSLSAKWIWDENNNFTTNPDPSGDNYVEEGGLYHYDPKDYSGQRESEKCQDLNDVLPCPAQLELPLFERWWHFAVTISLILIIYAIYFLRKKGNSKKKPIKKTKTKK